jgi:4-carboxymuconolactone decarboxylase
MRAMNPSDYPADAVPPGPYQEFKRRHPAVVEAYENLGKTCHEHGPLEPKQRELVKLGICVGAGLESATRAHVRLGLASGATPEELRHAALLAITTIGFPSMMRAMSWIDGELAAQGGQSGQ